ncbi:MAG TPA: hypothetical protein VGM89_12670 [Puia sp.]|jgi:hypothetical protein
MENLFFADPINGQIVLSVVANGFKQDTQTRGTLCGFSLLMGLVQSGGQAVPVSNPLAFVSDIRKKVQQSLSSMQFIAGGYTNTLDKVLGGNILTTDLDLRWGRMLSARSFAVGDERAILRNARTEAGLSDKDLIRENLRNLKPLFPHLDKNSVAARHMEVVARTAGGPEAGSRLFSLLQPQAGRTTELGRNIVEQDARYQDIHVTGGRDARQHSAFRLARQQAVAATNILDWIHSLFQHPGIARHYGLIQDFFIPIDDLRDKYITGDPAAVKEVTLTIKDNAFAPAVRNNDAVADIKSRIHCSAYTLKINNADRFYHGLKNGGLVPNDAKRYFFKTISDDLDLQQQKSVSDALAANQPAVDGLVDFAKIKATVTEGVYLYRTDTDDLALRDNSYAADATDNTRQEIETGILGQAITARIDGDKTLYSLCRREVTYTVKGNNNPLQEEEEGWLHTQSGISGENGAYHSQTVFSWTGQNLGVMRSDVGQADQRLTDADRETKGGGVHGTLSHRQGDNDALVKDNPYDWKYHLVPGRDIQLTSNRNYTFWVRHVQANGYTMPLDSSVAKSPVELTLADLLAANPAVENGYAFPFGTFSLHETPVNPPMLLARQEFRGKGKKTAESETHLVTYAPGQVCQRLVFPAAIGLQFAQLLGLLSKDQLGAVSERDYYEQGMKVVRRASVKPPASDSGLKPDIRYLADTRGIHLVLTPADWITRNYLLSGSQNLYVWGENFFRFNPGGDFYAPAVAGSLHLQVGDRDSVIITDNKIEFTALPGRQLNWQVQLQDGQGATAFNTFSSLNTAANSGFWISLYHLPFYARANFSLTTGVEKPEKPVFQGVPGRPGLPVTIAKRPSMPGQTAKAFFSFSLVNSNQAAVRQVKLISEYVRLNDDGHSTVGDAAFDADVQTWQKTHGGQAGMQLLNNECPASIFNQTAKNIGTDAYPNRFGFSLKLDDAAIRLIPPGLPVVTLNAGNNFTIQLLAGASPDKAQITINGNSVVQTISGPPATMFVDLRKRNDIRFTYDLAFAGNTLSLRASVNEVVGDWMDAQNFLPFPELCARNISLHPALEQYLLIEPVPEFQWAHQGDYFYYNQEDSAGYLLKKMRARTVSWFADLYPNTPPEGLYSPESDELTVEIPNNIPPVVPVLALTPLLAHETVPGKEAEVRRRRMEILIELERPLQNNEMLGLIITEGGGMTRNTCAIGRDLTTYSTHDFIDAGHADGIALTDVLVTANKSPYISKYYPTAASGLVKAFSYELLPLQPFFEREKGKWIAVVALDQDKLREKTEQDAYNPFLKIVAAKYNPSALTSNNALSPLTKPQYINVLTERIISIRRGGDRRNPNLTISIGNAGQLKKDNAGKTLTVFVAALRRRKKNGVAEDLTGIRFQVLDPANPNYVSSAEADEVAVYEFETFSDGGPDLSRPTDIDWLNDNRARLIYAEVL